MNSTLDVVSNPSRRWKTTVVLMAIVGLVFYLYGIRGNAQEAEKYGNSAIAWLVNCWGGFGSDFSYGWVIPIVSIVLLWRKRDALVSAARSVGWLGLAIVGASLLLYWFGMRTQQTRVTVMSLVGLLWGIPCYLYGRQVGKILLFPCAYLLFCIPPSLLDIVTGPLRLFASATATAILNGLGVMATRQGTLIFSTAPGGFRLGVDDPCSGLNSLFAIAALTAVYAHTLRMQTWKKWLLFAAALPLAVVGNVGRIVTVGIVAQWFGSTSGMAFYHDYSGYIVFILAVVLMTVIGNFLSEKQAVVSDRSPAAYEPDGSTAARSAIVVVLLVVTLVVQVCQKEPIIGDMTDLRVSLPAVVGDYRGSDRLFCQNELCPRNSRPIPDKGEKSCPDCGSPVDQLSRAEKRLLPPDTVVAKKRYENSSGEIVMVSIVTTGRERRSIHKPESCLAAQGNTIERSRTISVPVRGRAPLAVRIVDVRSYGRNGGNEAGALFASYAYWFSGGGRETASNLERMFWMSADRVFYNVVSRWSYVAVTTDRPSASGDSTNRISAFIGDLYPLISSRESNQP